jgi:hypothetical protein
MREILDLEASTAPDDNTTIPAKGDVVVRRDEMPAAARGRSRRRRPVSHPVRKNHEQFQLCMGSQFYSEWCASGLGQALISLSFMPISPTLRRGLGILFAL